ncbi:MAG: hypothetical protein ACI4C1_06975 [Lachnospiraceae bacterium]
MDIATKINIALCILSFVLAAISVVTVVITLRQNSKMIEESSRAIISIYGESINPGAPMFYIVIKNFGHSLAVITKFHSDFDFSDCYGFKTDRNFINDLNNSSIAPGQSRICRLDYDKITRPITFEIEYLSASKKYSEKITVDLKAGSSMLVSKVSTTDKELRTIAYTLQEMLQKNL